MTSTVLRTDAQLDELARDMGRLIESERRRVGLTQADVAERLGVTQNAVTSWERAVRHGALHLSTILALESLFGLQRGAILQRLGLVTEHPDFEAVVLANLRLTESQKVALIGVYRAMVGD